MRHWGSLLALFLVVSCGSDAASGPVDQPANPCATPNATYFETFEEVSGSCGPIPSSIINVNPDRTITSDTVLKCAKATQSGCTARDTACKWSSQGFNFTMTLATTFADDGSSAMGVATLSGSGQGQNCSSTYNITITRQ